MTHLTDVDPRSYGTLFDSLVRTVARFPDRPAYAVPHMPERMHHPDGIEFTWSQTKDAVERLREIYRSAGYGLGHRVAILFDQRPEFLFHFFALNSLGCSVVPVNPDYRHDEIEYLLSHSETSLAVAIAPRLAHMKNAAQSCPNVAAVVSFDDFPQSLPAPLTPVAEGSPDASTEAALLYTSGTTGRPKGCVMSNEYFHMFGSCYLTRGGVLDFREGVDRLYNPLPLHHANCLSISMPAMLLSGNCLVFPDRFHASTWWRDVVECQITALQFQGIIPNILLKLPFDEHEREHKVRFAFCAGCEPEHHVQFEARFGIPLVEMWSMSEAGRFISDHLEPRAIDTRSFGRPSPGIEAKLVDELDVEVPVGTPGQLLIRHSEAEPRKGFFSGYLKNDAATEEAWRGGWFHTGDVAVRDETNRFRFVDRSKHIIRRAGENISPAEVEACLILHADVHQAAVIAVQDEVREEEVMACIVPAGDVADPTQLARDLLAFCNERLAYYKAPAWFLFLDKLPTTSSQKLHKISLFADGDPRQRPNAIDLRALKKKLHDTGAVTTGPAAHSPSTDIAHTSDKLRSAS
ncbi:MULTISPECIES: AMP-binding protein [Paraburkholderia]|uniref:AMP-binding protein n=1 Tax=Paraburkholderia TaxID=1822464 RepID=UPI0038BDB7DE